MTYRDDSERREIYLQRLATGLLNAHVYPSLDEAIKAARIILMDAEIDTDAKRIKIIRAVEKEMRPIIEKGFALTTEGLVAIAIYEAEFAKDLIEHYQGVKLKSAKDKAELILKNSMMTLTSGQRTTSNFWEAYVLANTDSAIALAVGEISRGYESGLATGTVMKNVRETALIAKRDAESLVRTGTSFYTSQAREQMAILNANVIKYREYNAVFDNRTTLGCRSLDGKRYEITDRDYVRVPRHFNCRSFYTFGTGPIDEPREGKRQATSGKDAEINPRRKLKYRGKKDQDIFDVKPIDAGLSQDEWLRKQPDWFIEDSLGQVRAKLFKEGAKIESFTDLTGRELTLDELKKRDAKIFERAGL